MAFEFAGIVPNYDLVFIHESTKLLVQHIKIIIIISKTEPTSQRGGGGLHKMSLEKSATQKAFI